MSLQTRRAAVLTVLALALTGCSGGGDGEDEGPSASTSSSPSSSVSSQGSAQTTPSDQQTSSTAAQEESSASPAPDPSQEATQPSAEADTGTGSDGPSGLSAQAAAFFASGGACYSDYFPSGTPSQEVLTEIQDYCATTDVSAWDLQDGVPNPFGVPDPAQHAPDAPPADGAGDGTADDDGYQSPATEADGTAGPSEVYYCGSYERLDVGTYDKPDSVCSEDEAGIALCIDPPPGC